MPTPSGLARSRPVLVVIAVVAGAVAAWQYARTAHVESPTGPAKEASLKGYVKPELCAQCHAAIATQYAKTGMGRSFYRMDAQHAAEGFRMQKPFYHEPSKSYFSVAERDGKYYQRRWQIGLGGKETNPEEKQIDFVMGSGNHGRTYLHLTSRNTLQQLPLGWYAENGGSFGMNPGYDRAEYQGSTRTIHYECMFCHNGYPSIPAGHEVAGSEAQYELPMPEGIDCQRCHGPGKAHIEAAGKAGAKREDIRAVIVNPARLAPDREMEVCMACHLETSSRKLPHAVQKLDRGPFSWVPGQSLADFRISFDREAGSNEEFEVAGAAYRLRGSQCFLKSETLRCTTCHNPHDVPRGEAATSHYNQVCRTCHTTAIQPVATHTPSANCTGCHMPKRRTDDAIHIVMTDHRIMRRPPAGNLLAAKAEKYESPTTSYRGEVLPYYPAKLPATDENALYVAMAQVMDGSNLASGTPRLAALLEKSKPANPYYYSTLATAWLATGERDKALTLLEQAAQKESASEVLLLQLGNALLESGQWAKAEAALRRAKDLKSDDAAAWGLLGWVLWQQDKKDEARTSLDKGIQLNPDLPELHNYRGAMLIGSGDNAGAEREFRTAIRINPGIAEWHDNLAKLLASQGNMAESQWEFEQSIRLQPRSAAGRLSYAKMLANTNRTTEAETQLKAALEAEPNAVEAHEMLGYILSARGDLAGALRELQTTLRMNPGIGRAHYELGLALGRMGQHGPAAEQLKAAAVSNDPQARAAAQELLQRLGR